MKASELEVYSNASNSGIVRMPGRQFPGVVVQGDSLSILHADARELSLCLKELNVNDEEVLHLAQGLQQKLLHRLLHYQQVLTAHGLALPYSSQVQEGDLVVLVPEARDVP